MFAALGPVLERHVSLCQTVVRVGQILRLHGEKGLILHECIARPVGRGELIAELARQLGA